MIKGIPATVNLVRLNRIKKLEKQRSRILKQISAFRSMLPGAYREVYCKCGKPNCWCYKKGGHLFRRITWSENSRSRTKAIPEKDINWIKELTENYREFQKKRRQIKELEGILNELIGEYAKAVIKKSRRQRDYL